jgi:phenylalanyl-tRNA synthetase beta chain
MLSFMMMNEERLFTKMNRQPSEVIEIANPKIMTMTCLRPWLLPGLMEFLANNTHVEYPQRMFEVGDCTVRDPAAPNRATDIRKLACVSSHSRANFTEMKSHLQPLMLNLGFEFALGPIVDPSYLEGRVGSILIGDRMVGLVGEVHPQVLENWKLENPVAAMELDLDQLFRLQRR